MFWIFKKAIIHFLYFKGEPWKMGGGHKSPICVENTFRSQRAQISFEFLNLLTVEILAIFWNFDACLGRFLCAQTIEAPPGFFSSVGIREILVIKTFLEKL